MDKWGRCCEKWDSESSKAGRPWSTHLTFSRGCKRLQSRRKNKSERKRAALVGVRKLFLGPDDKYFRLCRPHSFCCNYSTLLLHHENWHVNEGHDCMFNKIIMKTGLEFCSSLAPEIIKQILAMIPGSNKQPEWLTTASWVRGEDKEGFREPLVLSEVTPCVVGRIMTCPKCPSSNSQNLWICFVTGKG